MKSILSICFTLLLLNLNAQNDWVQKADLPGVARHHPVTFTLDGEGYVVTGVGAPFVLLNDFHKYDPTTDTWTTLPSFPGGARGFAYGADFGGKGYIGFGLGAGSQRLNDLWEFDPVSGQWTQLASCPCTGRRHPAFLITSDGKIHVGLGDDAVTGNQRDWWVYDIATDSWEQKDNLPGKARHHPYYFAIGTDAFVGFGHGNGIFNDFYVFDSTTDDWTELADFPGEERVAGAQFDWNDMGYIISGEGVDHQNLDEGEFYRYNPLNDTWYEQEPHPGAARWASGTFVIDDTVYHIAGEDENSTIQKDMWAYDLTKTVFVAGDEEIAGGKGSIQVYPNPSDGNLWISSQSKGEYAVLDLHGRLLSEGLLESGSSSIELPLSPATYLVQVIDAESTHSFRVVRQ